MKKLFYSVILFWFLPVSLFSQRLVSPEILQNHQAVFRFYAPNAREIKLRLEGEGSLAMVKDPGGVWSVTSDTLQPDIYTYHFVVDGISMPDPNNPLLKYNLLNTESEVDIPGPSSLPWMVNDVPHGQVHRHFYRSRIVGDSRDFYVYTPPAYQPQSKEKYPVLYLLHGYSDDATAWINVGRANFILDNLIAQGKAKPMIVVMPLGYGNWQLINNGWSGLSDTSVWDSSFDKFRESLLQELIPEVEKNYQVIKDKNARAIAGLSMGGAQSLIFGLNAPEMFTWIGAYSTGGLRGSFDYRFPKVNKDINKQLHLLWIACGKKDGLIRINRDLVSWLKKKEIKCTWTETEGEHSFRVWRRYLAEFLPLLF
jgi:enterochelin esterase family protein